jgi:hypothetical protein
MAGRNLSRGFFKAFGPLLTRKPYVHRDDGVAAFFDLCGLLSNPMLKSFTRNPNRPADPNGWQKAGCHHGEHLRPPEAK